MVSSANIAGGVAGAGVNSANCTDGENSTDGEAGSGFAGVKKAGETHKDFCRSFFLFLSGFF